MTPFEEFLIQEAKQLEGSKNLLGTRIAVFENLSNLFRSPIDRMISLQAGHWMHVWQYQFVQYHMFFSFSCLLRSHLSECFASMRAAIDAALMSYYCLEEPNGEMQYYAFIKELPGAINFRMIKRIIARRREKNPTSFPLAATLLGYHDMFSRMGSHADPETIHGYRTAFEGNENVGQFEFSFFQRPPDPKDFIVQYILLLNVYYQILRALKPFLDRNIRVIDPLWENDFVNFIPAIRGLAVSEGITPDWLANSIEKLRSDISDTESAS